MRRPGASAVQLPSVGYLELEVAIIERSVGQRLPDEERGVPTIPAVSASAILWSINASICLPRFLRSC